MGNLSCQPTLAGLVNNLDFRSGIRRAKGLVAWGLFPHYCVLCGLASQRTRALCRGCEGDLRQNTHACYRCALPLPASSGGKTDSKRECGQCLRTPPAFDHANIPWIYDDHFAHIIQRWKFAGERGLTSLLAKLWSEASDPPAPIDLLLPVPLHWRKRWRRGFNQAELLAQSLAAQSGPALRVDSRCVRRTIATGAQSSMGAAERHTNLRGAFTVDRPCDNLSIAIVDDVMTTGATASSLAGALKAAGANRVDLWCIARTPAPGS